MSLRVARILATLLLGLTLFLPGCFDYQLKLVLRPHLDGTFTATLQIPEGMEAEFKGGPDEIQIPEPQRGQEHTVNGMVDLVSIAPFKSMRDLTTKRVRFFLERVDMGLLGMRSDTFRLTAWLRPAEGDRPDRDQPLGTELDDRLPAGAGPAKPENPDAARADELLAASLGGHYLSMTWVLPGKIEKAWGLNVGGRRVEPLINAARDQVVWRVPLALLATARVRHTLIFRADFVGDLTFKAENVHEVGSNWTEDKPAPGEKQGPGEPGQGKEPTE